MSEYFSNSINNQNNKNEFHIPKYSTTLSLKTLYQTCLEYLAKHLLLYCESTSITETSSFSTIQHQCKSNSNNNKELHFKEKSFKLNNTISEDLIEKLSELNKLNDLTISLFTSKQTCLKHVKIKNATLKRSSLKILKEHLINELMLNHLITIQQNGLNVNNTRSISPPNSISSSLSSSSSLTQSNNTNNDSITINDVLNSLNDETKLNLRSLDVSHNDTLFIGILSNCKQFEKLVKLNVSYTYFNNHSLETITQDLVNLEYLDISGTRVCNLQPLLRLKFKLKYLFMYNLRATLNDNMIPVIGSLNKLIQLDLSKDVSTQLFADLNLNRFNINMFLTENKLSFENLQFIDISGLTDINQDLLIKFIEANQSIKFLGLAVTSTLLCEQITNNAKIKSKLNLIITGEATQEQMTISLKYYKLRPSYIQRILGVLFNSTVSLTKTNIDLIEDILNLMHLHLKSVNIQVAATATLFNLTRQELNKTIPLALLNNVVHMTLKIMDSFPNTLQLLRNCLSIIRNERIIKECSFDRYMCAKLALDLLLLHKDTFITNSAVNLCSLLAYHISREKLTRLSDVRYMNRLLQILKDCLNGSNYVLMIQILSTLWNFSDESPVTCKNFIDLDGLSVYSNLIENYNADVTILINIVGLISNLAEMKQIRQHLLKDFIFTKLEKLLLHDDASLKYLLAGIFAHLLADNDVNWHEIENKENFSKNEFISKIEQVITSWTGFSSYVGCYRSFCPFVCLLDTKTPQISQLWAVWAITHVIKSNPHRYMKEIKKLDIQNKIKLIMNSIHNNDDKNSLLYKVCSESIEMLEQQQQ